MPGYDRERIVGVADKTLDELICAICYAVLKNPLMTDCCQQTFCDDCITEWIGEQNSCPNCRKVVMSSQLRPIPRLLKNMIDELIIKCEFQRNGCSSRVTIGQLAHHMECCPHNPKALCKTCGLEQQWSQHNCVDSLIAEINSIKLNLTKGSFVAHKSLIEEALTDPVNHHIIKRDNASDKLVTFIRDKCVQAMTTKSHFREISEFIHDRLMEHQSYRWHKWCVLVGNDSQYNITHTIDIAYDNYLVMKFRDIKIAIMSFKK